ncbi:hypothetical protein [Sporomusa sphaeroides]|uniref:hypothetical protein n=1 Tax=Sporomusa sphaeroides TaxID=47679 RepID=UPI000952E52C|nr:hypothetical protein [Sporomusa sphaeroides]
MKEQLEAAQQWVPVSPETMPGNGQRIIVNDVKLGFGVGTYRKDMTLHDKTHWMIIPPLPGTEGTSD